MIVKTAEIRLHAPWVHSLKEKRMEVKSLLAKVKNRFNVSAIESGEQDVHQIILLGLACAANTLVLAESEISAAIAFIEQNTDASVTEVIQETR